MDEPEPVGRDKHINELIKVKTKKSQFWSLLPLFFIEVRRMENQISNPKESERELNILTIAKENWRSQEMANYHVCIHCMHTYINTYHICLCNINTRTRICTNTHTHKQSLAGIKIRERKSSPQQRLRLWRPWLERFNHWISVHSEARKAELPGRVSLCLQGSEDERDDLCITSAKTDNGLLPTGAGTGLL